MSTSKLSHIVAVHKSVKATAAATLTNAHHKAQRGDNLKGQVRVHQPLDDNEIAQPTQSQKIQYTAKEILLEVANGLCRLFDVEATQDFGNTVAFADVEVDGRVLVHQAPVSYLLFLEKQLVDLGTFIKKLPVLDATESWTYDEGAGHFRTEPVKTVSNKKVYRNHVKAEATDKHPAQVEVYTEDIPVAYWSTTKFSGALPATQVKELSERVVKLQEAVKVAREKANATEVENKVVGETVLGWLFS